MMQPYWWGSGTGMMFFPPSSRFIIFFLFVWAGFWKALALWHAGRRGEKIWFIVLFIINSVGILELIYLAFIAKVFVSAPKKSSRRK